jgi:hemerythrin-like domain-containing protein
MNAFELLKTDHRKVAELFDRLESASGQAKLSIFKQIKSELELHTHIEEKFFYPALEPPKETHDLTLEAYEEHKVVKDLLAELSGSKSADDEWQAKAKVLRENVEHHVDEEENELFDKADDVLSDEENEALGRRMEAEKARKLGRPQPVAKKQTRNQGIVARIKEFVGLGSQPAATKSAARKKTAKKSTKKSTKKAAKKSAKKSRATVKRSGKSAKKAAPQAKKPAAKRASA